MANRDQILQGAEKLLARGKLDQALREYLRVLDENPRDISTLNKVGDLYVRINRPADSIPFFTRIADFYAKDGFFLKAIAIYKKINKIDPARLEVYEQLADLYHKQGLTQDARSQYQVLADHYTKGNKPQEAISAYKRMAAVDPADLKIQARLADLYRASRQIPEAVKQYALIGNALLQRGANDEAAAVFQKALEIAPGDALIQRGLVRAFLAQRNAPAAIALLKNSPRTADTLGLLAEAQFESGDAAEAMRLAEEGLGLDSSSEGCRLQLARALSSQGKLDAAYAAAAPAVDAAVAAGDFARALAHLSPILEADPGHPASIGKMAEVRETEGRPAEAASLVLILARDAERRGDAAAAVDLYRRVVKLAPLEGEAIAKLKELAPPPAPAAETSALPEIEVEIEDEAPPVHAPQPRVASLPFETEPEASVPRVPAIPVSPLAPPPAPAATSDEREVETLVVEAEVFARYGLADKAVERLRALVRRRPDLVRARERLVELMAESQNPALPQEVEELAGIYRRSGREADAEALRRRHPGAIAPPPPAARAEAAFDEFGIDAPAARRAAGVTAPMPAIAPADEFGDESLRGPAPEPARPSAPRVATPSDSEFVSYEELGTLLEDEMHKAEEAPAPPAAETPVVDEQSLFADERQFFNLAEELEKELADEPAATEAAVEAGPQGEASLEEIFREFKKGVEQQLSAEDYETHFNLGIAYKEMGLTDEAIGEFQLASKDPARMVECCSMLGLCFLEKGMPQLAVKWYRKGLEAPDIKEVETVGLLYDLACVYQDTGETDLAYRTFLEVYGLNTNYRDIVSRVKDLEAVKKN